MNSLQSVIRAGLTAMVMLLAVVEVAWPQTTSRAPSAPVPSAPVPSEGVGGYGLVAFLLIMGLIIAVGVAVKLYDVKRKREDEGVALQSRLSDAFLSDPSLAGYAVTPTVHVPFSQRSPITMTLTGTVPSGAKRDRAMQLVKQVAVPYEGNYEIEDRLLVDPQLMRRAA
jgi:hypothetical protein